MTGRGASPLTCQLADIAGQGWFARLVWKPLLPVGRGLALNMAIRLLKSVRGVTVVGELTVTRPN